MDRKKKAPQSEAPGISENKRQKNNNKIPRKIHRVVAALCRRSYNLFEAERELHDHCLSSTVADIQSDHGINVEREWETVNGFQGAPTKVRRYWIAADQVEKARRILKTGPKQQ